MANLVMIPLDGSTLAEQALPLGVSLAQQISSDSVVQLVQVVPKPSNAVSYISTPNGDISPLELVDAFWGSAQSYLSKMKEELAEVGIPVETCILEGDVGQVLADLANEQETCYIVMSTHGRGGLSRWALGSVADQLLHLSKRPLIIMRPQGAMQVTMPRALHLENNLSQLKRIVVPLDGSPLAEQVLPHVKKLARAYEAELLLFRSVSLVPPSMIGADVALLEKKLYEVNRNEARDYLKRIKVNLQIQGFKVSIEVGGAPTADAILRYATQVDADLIAMATHARGAIGRLIWGSVTDGVIRAGQMPVLVTKAETKES